MKKIVFILLAFTSTLLCQQYNKINLNNGDIYVCTIIENNQELEKYVVQLKDGSEFYIQYSLVKSIKLIPIANQGSIGFGYGDLYNCNNGIGINFNYFITNNIALLIGYGRNRAYFRPSSSQSEWKDEDFISTIIGAKYFFRSFYEMRRPTLSLTYGHVGFSSIDPNGVPIISSNSTQVVHNQYNGLIIGIGFQYMFGTQKKHGFDIEFCYHAQSKLYDWNMKNNQRNSWRLGFSIGYRYAFHSIEHWLSILDK